MGEKQEVEGDGCVVGKPDVELSKKARWLKRPRYKVVLGRV